ncbi:hypothetical protein [Ostreibacterium oceani]|uniref:Uncharacterized protein n=1 Tax=Ostreibacterium oceani TaxID=2654998 RepID=A0A6N7EYX8_9GAMM|nr:hypothetical protein [Ostreibacterium oceani]MPV86367.1 hypothetical protein [Ostreibacterium oceani]
MVDDSHFQGNIAEALYFFQNNGKNRHLWHHPDFSDTLKKLDNIKASLHVLKKHLPKKYHDYVRFSQPKTVWNLHVEKTLIGNQLNLLLDELSLRIAKDIGYAPRLKVIVTPANWKNSGFPLFYTPYSAIKTPDKETAQRILQAFINGHDDIE